MTSASAGKTLAGAQPRRHTAVGWTNGQLAMALFLSTEAMFFGALVSSYFIFRWSVAHGVWPDAATVHLDPRIGWLNTVILLASGWALSRSTSAARAGLAGSAKGWLCVAIVGATLFLGIKGYEYWEKYRAGILSLPGENAIHEAPDLAYLARLKVFFENQESSLSGAAAASEATAGEMGSGNAATSDAGAREVSAASGAGAERLGDPLADPAALRRALKGALVTWPTRAVGRSAADPVMNRWIIRSTAHLVAPQAERQELADFLSAHQRDIETLFQQRSQQYTELQASLAGVQQEIAKLREAGDAANPPTVPGELNARAAALTQQLTELNLELGPLGDRRWLLSTMQDHWHEGVNHRFGWRIPQVIPSGAAWVNAYVMLTGCHALHVLGGIVAMLCCLPFRLDGRWWGVLRNLGYYWLFVDAVWLVVFPLVYLI